MSDPFDLSRFIAAQRSGYSAALSDRRNGAKREHWMWYIFPQIAGLGRSEMARHFAISSLAEARAYLAHPVLGPRLRECVRVLQDVTGSTAKDVFGETDAMKLRSSLTLFLVASREPLFAAALCQWFGGQHDAATLDRIERTK